MGNIKYVNEATKIRGRMRGRKVSKMDPHINESSCKSSYVQYYVCGSLALVFLAELPSPTTFCNALSHPLSRHNCLCGCVSIRVRKTAQHEI